MSEWFFNDEMSAYNFYTKVLQISGISYLPDDTDYKSPLDELKEPLDAITRVRVRLLQSIERETPNQTRHYV
jgi:hypothetical protein